MRATILRARLRALARAGFLRREDGAVAIEAMIILPMLFWTYLSIFSIFDAFQTYSINQKAAYTIGDAISRETVPLNNAYLSGVHDLFEYMSRSKDQSAMRVTSIYFDAANNRYRRVWSQTRGWVTPLTSGDVRNWHDRLPKMLDNEHVVLLETWSNYTPPFATGLEKREIRNFVFTRPRYATRVCWETCD
jgi:hypothetical protein